ncbi:hypothetical protein P5673_017681 [Acropora cervicornis]|uniref:Uncharacterized protein n=1 Tax=Acropora cervicornis TaxID=6130 RepID=A0AAD9QE15_ACRCE|nr:hypothetical protein P5673_017681 [Acropora cervicornis]
MKKAEKYSPSFLKTLNFDDSLDFLGREFYDFGALECKLHNDLLCKNRNSCGPLLRIMSQPKAKYTLQTLVEHVNRENSS